MVSNVHATAVSDVCDEEHAGLACLLRRQRYSHVLLMAGTNGTASSSLQPAHVCYTDCARPICPDLGVSCGAAIGDRLCQLHALCHTAGAQTVALSIPESRCVIKGPAFIGERRCEANTLVREFAGRVPTQCTYIPMDEAVPWTAASPNWEADGLHMSAEGYRVFAAELTPKLRILLAATAETCKQSAR